LVIFSLIGGLFGIVATRGPIARLHRLTAATMRFAAGQYDQRLPATAHDEIGQLEAHFNPMAQHLASSLAQQTWLAQQNARLEERARLSRDLHDSVKQHLFALAMQVEVALSTLDAEHTSTRVPLQEAEALIAQVQHEVAALIAARRPTPLQTQGLMAALRDMVLMWSRQSDIEVDLQLPDTCSLPPPVEEALWWVAQEALSNVARHSQASRVHLCLEYTEQQVRLCLSDNGSGFDPAERAHAGLGLRSMQERMGHLGGTLYLHSLPGEGTALVAACPLPSQAGRGHREREDSS
jgi:NarL family two-component system sensor histidine kinase LiaS